MIRNCKHGRETDDCFQCDHEQFYDQLERAEREQQQQLEADREAAGLCIGCGKPGTMGASLGLTCFDCYDDYS